MSSGSITCERKGDKLTFYVVGSFDFALGVELKNLAKKQPKAKEYAVDLEGLTYINSSAFGAMLFLRELFGANNDSLSLINASPDILKMIKAIKFDTIFRVI
jgi:anti-anti-sigma factor